MNLFLKEALDINWYGKTTFSFKSLSASVI